MPDNKNRQFLDFEKPIKDLFDEIDKLKQTAEKTKVDLSDSIHKLEEQVLDKRKEITQQLSSWQKVQLSRHPDRPYTGLNTTIFGIVNGRNSDNYLLNGTWQLHGL